MAHTATDTRGFPVLRALPECKEPPWHFIGRLWLSGQSVVSLARRFKVNERQLRQYLQKHCKPDGSVRSDVEVRQASNLVRDDLVSTLLKASAALKAKDGFTKDDLAALEKLTNTASKLFAWPASKPVESAASVPLDENAGAINLHLQRLTPEQIRNAG